MVNPTANTHVFINKEGQQHGPYSLEQLNELLEAEQVTGEDLFWYEGCPDWRPLSQFPGFATSSAAAPVVAQMRPAALSQLRAASTTSPSGATCAARAQDAEVHHATPSVTHREALAFTMLGLPVLAALLLWQSGNLGLSDWMAYLVPAVVVVATTVLARLDVQRLAKLDPRRKDAPEAYTPFMLLLWVVGFPLYLHHRRQYGGKSYLVPAIVVAALMIGAPILAEAPLPAVDAPEVITAVEAAIRDSPGVKLLGLEGPVKVSDPGELSFDRSKQRRTARAMLKTSLGSEVVHYSVEWQNRKKGIIWVEIISGIPSSSPSSPATKGKAPEVTMADYQNIRIGMTYAEVSALLRSPGEETQNSGDMKGYLWSNSDGSFIGIVFNHDRVADKQQASLDSSE